MTRWLLRGAVSLWLLATTRAAWGGGIEMPDLGAAALGRGAAFTATADDGMACHYNVAGYAQQRGTRVMLSVNLLSRSYEFTRRGQYPDDPANPLTPWGGQPYPVVKGEGGIQPIPTLSLSSDFGLPRWTFFAALLTPSPASTLSFPLGVHGGVPNPARYMTSVQKGALAYPTLGVAHRAFDALDVGVAGHLVVSEVDAYTVASFDTSPKSCPNAEYQPCDVVSRVRARGAGFAASVGALARVSPEISIGANLRTRYTLPMEGTVTTMPPKASGATEETSRATLELPFPWALKTGVRYAHRDGGAELFDAELNFTLETWSDASVQRGFIPKASFLENIDASVDNHYQDSMSVRLGGSYHATDSIVVRAGGFYETPSAPVSETRVGAAGVFEKIGVTLGLGVTMGNLRLNAAYALVMSPTLEVRDGTVRPSNAARRGAPLDSGEGGGQLYPATNEGSHSTSAQIFALSVEYRFGGGAKSTSKSPQPPDLSPQAPEPPVEPDYRAAPDARATPNVPSPTSSRPSPSTSDPTWTTERIERATSRPRARGTCRPRAASRREGAPCR